MGRGFIFEPEFYSVPEKRFQQDSFWNVMRYGATKFTPMWGRLQ